MDKKKKAGAKSPVAKSASAKSPVRGRSKSRGRPPKKEVEKTPARSKSRSRKDKSKARGRAKSRSPKPRGRSQSGRSLSRTRTQSRNLKEKDLSDIETDKKLNLVLTDVLQQDFAKESKLNEIIRRSISRDISSEKSNINVRRSTRISTFQSIKQAEESKKLDGLKRQPPKTSTSSRIWGFLSLFKIATGFIFPAFILLVHLACTKDQCTISKFHIPRNPKVYLNVEAVATVFGFLALQFLLVLLPVGRKVGGPGRSGQQYRCNGLLSTILTVAIIAGLWYLKYPVTFVYEKYLPMIIGATAYAFLLSVCLYVKGGKAPVPGLNPDGILASRVDQFLIGRELNPIFFKHVNVKTLLMRFALNGAVVLNGLLALKAFEVRNEASPTLLTCIGLYALLIIDFYWFEDSFSSTFESMYEGVGFNVVSVYFVYPFLPSLITKYIIQHRVELPAYALAAIAVVFAIGFFIYRASNLQKAAFRKNPLNPALAHFETISTTRGKKLLVAGWWGWVRHPNYLGDIVLHWAWTSCAGYSHAIPYVFPLLTTLILLHRAVRVDRHCQQKYQSSWEEFCSRVRYRILPRIY